jgi:putative transcriptional regulator
MSGKDRTGLSNQIRRFRFENNELTQQALATQVGVSRQTIIALESGKYSPSLILALKIAKNFNVRVEDIFQLVEES